MPLRKCFSVSTTTPTLRGIRTVTPPTPTWIRISASRFHCPVKSRSAPPTPPSKSSSRKFRLPSPTAFMPPPRVSAPAPPFPKPGRQASHAARRRIVAHLRLEPRLVVFGLEGVEPLAALGRQLQGADPEAEVGLELFLAAERLALAQGGHFSRCAVFEVDSAARETERQAR